MINSSYTHYIIYIYLDITAKATELYRHQCRFFISLSSITHTLYNIVLKYINIYLFFLKKHLTRLYWVSMEMGFRNPDTADHPSPQYTNALYIVSKTIAALSTYTVYQNHSIIIVCRCIRNSQNTI